MKKFLTVSFVVLGVIFLVLVLLFGILYFFNPLGIKDTISTYPGFDAMSESSPAEDKHSGLSATQEKTLEVFGIDPASVPESFTDEQIKCFVEKLGQERVDEIKGGSSPTMTEYLKAKDCI